jgi:hypothetical protein
MLDRNSIDTIESSTQIHIINDSDYIDADTLEQLEEPVKAQYIEFESLGVDLLKNVTDESILREIFGNLIEYVNDNYTAITEYDSVIVSPQKLMLVGRYVYEFICIDAPFNLIPNYLLKIDQGNVDQFENYIKTVLKNDPSRFKASFMQCIKSIVDKLSRLQKLNKDIINDKNYQRLLNKYKYYLELVNYGDSSRFLEDYIKPIMRKHEDDIIWRTF